MAQSSKSTASGGGLNGAYYGPSIPPARRTHRSIGRSSDCCDPCGCLLCFLFKLVFSIVVVLGIILLVLWLVFRPNELRVYAENADLSTFNFSNSSSTLSYNLSLSLSIRNPNRRISIYYDSLEAVALYDGSRFGYDGSIPPFFQGHKNTTVVSAGFQGQALSLGVVKGTFEREKAEGNFFVQVKFSPRIRLKVKFVKVGHFKPKFDCNLKLPVPPAKGFERTRCDVDWI